MPASLNSFRYSSSKLISEKIFGLVRSRSKYKIEKKNYQLPGMSPEAFIANNAPGRLATAKDAAASSAGVPRAASEEAPASIAAKGAACRTRQTCSVIWRRERYRICTIRVPIGVGLVFTSFVIRMAQGQTR
jgi:hypothetical protein